MPQIHITQLKRWYKKRDKSKRSPVQRGVSWRITLHWNKKEDRKFEHLSNMLYDCLVFGGLNLYFFMIAWEREATCKDFEAS